MVKLPLKFDELLPAAALEKVVDALQRPNVNGTIREALNRVGLQDAHPLEKAQKAWQQARSWIESVVAESGSKVAADSLINASGSLFPKECDSVPLDPSLAYSWAAASQSWLPSSELEAKAKLAVESALKCDRFCTFESMLASIIALHACVSKKGGKLFVARSDLLRIPGLGDLRSLLTGSGFEIAEVGAVNGSSEQDWAASNTSENDCIFLISPNGLTSENATQQRQAALQQAGSSDCYLVQLLADGVASASLSEQFGFPLAAASSENSKQVTLLPTNLLLGGPTGVFAFGDPTLTQAMQSMAEQAGVQLRGAAMSTAASALGRAALVEEFPTRITARLLANAENLQNRAARLATQLAGIGLIEKAEAVKRTAPLGPSPWSMYSLDNWCVELSISVSSTEFARSLMNPLAENTEDTDEGSSGQQPDAEPADDESVSGEAANKLDAVGSELRGVLVAVDANRVWIDLRFVAPEDDYLIVLACQQTAS